MLKVNNRQLIKGYIAQANKINDEISSASVNEKIELLKKVITFCKSHKNDLKCRNYFPLGDNEITKYSFEVLYTMLPYMKGVEQLLLGYKLSGVKSFNPLAFSNIKYFELKGNNIEDKDITSIGNLLKLEFLDLSNNKIKDITPLGALEKLESLYLAENEIEDITPLGNLNLQVLDLSNNKIKDITIISALKNLTHFYSSNNPIQDYLNIIWSKYLQKVILDKEIWYVYHKVMSVTNSLYFNSQTDSNITYQTTLVKAGWLGYNGYTNDYNKSELLQQIAFIYSKSKSVINCGIRETDITTSNIEELILKLDNKVGEIKINMFVASFIKQFDLKNVPIEIEKIIGFYCQGDKNLVSLTGDVVTLPEVTITENELTNSIESTY